LIQNYLVEKQYKTVLLYYEVKPLEPVSAKNEEEDELDAETISASDFWETSFDTQESGDEDVTVEENRTDNS
jgi:hypothetical protein